MNQEQDHIGCIDGKTIALHRQGGEFVLRFDRAEARLSKEAATRLANLLMPPSKLIHKPKKRRAKSSLQRLSNQTSKETITDLLQEGMLNVGSVLTMSHHGKDYYATVTSRGALDLNGHIELTPSDAGKWVTGQVVDGWLLWSIRDGELLAHLRWRLRAINFLGDNHGYVPSHIQEKRMIAKGWVDYALEKRLDLSTYNNKSVEEYLIDRQIQLAYSYAEGTLDQYRRHLRQWFKWCEANNW